MTRSSAIRLAVIGTGVWARKVHYPTLAHLSSRPAQSRPFALHGVCSLDLPEARRLAAAHGFGRVYADLDELLADREVEAVAVIVMPQNLPALVARLQVMQVPLLVEKPPGADAIQAAELARTVTVPHIVSFNRRFAPLVTRLRDEVRRLAAPVFAEGRFYRHGRLDPDFIRGTGIHLINTMEYVCGPVAWARTTRRRHPGAATWGWFTELEFASGLGARLHFLPCTGMQVEQIEVHAAARSLVLEVPAIGSPRGILSSCVTADGDKPGADVAPADLPPCGSTGGYQALFNPTTTETTASPADEEPLQTCGFVGAYEELAGLVRGGDSRSTFRDSVASMRLAEAIETAAEYRGA